MSKELELSRRKALGALGTIGIAAAGAGAGTTAFLNDREDFTGNSVQAGTLNLAVDYEVYADQGSRVGTTSETGTMDGNEPSASFGLSDMKPGDDGWFKFCPRVSGNPGYVWARAKQTGDSEGDNPEPEIEAEGGDVGSEGELDDEIEAQVRLGAKDATPLYEGTLAEVLNWLNNGGGGVLLDYDPTDGSDGSDPITAYPGDGDSTRCVYITWQLPAGTGNSIQGDGVEFDVTFAAEQERHNDASESPINDSSS